MTVSTELIRASSFPNWSEVVYHFARISGTLWQGASCWLLSGKMADFMSPERWDEKADPRSRITLSCDQRTSKVQSRWITRSTLKKHNKSAKKSERSSKRAKSRVPVQRDTKEVLAELSANMRKALYPLGSKAIPAMPMAPRSVATAWRQATTLVAGLERRKLVDEKDRANQSFDEPLEDYFPQMLQWFEQQRLGPPCRQPARCSKEVSLLLSGYSRSRSAMITFISACACAIVTPGFRRPRRVHPR